MAVWNTNMVLEFLELFAAEPALYDPKHPYYKNKIMIDIAWMRILEGFSIKMPMSEIKKKKDSLMASFRYQMRKKKEAALIGESVHKKAWFAFDIMYGFLGKIYENENASSSTEDSQGPILEFVGFDALDENFFNDGSSPAPQEHKPELTSQNSVLESILLKKEPLTASKRKQPLDTEQLETQSLSDRVSTDSQNDENDECDLYGKLIAKKLRKLPEAQREKLMYEIQGLFTKASQKKKKKKKKKNKVVQID